MSQEFEVGKGGGDPTRYHLRSLGCSGIGSEALVRARTLPPTSIIIEVDGHQARRHYRQSVRVDTARAARVSLHRPEGVEQAVVHVTSSFLPASAPGVLVVVEVLVLFLVGSLGLGAWLDEQDAE